MDEPLVSWHCLTYGRPELLRELYYFFITQTYENRELIIINDQINIKYICDSPKVHIYNLNERFPSLGAKRNFAMTKCNGEFILITDDDDYYAPDHTKHLVEFHQENIHMDIVMDCYCSYTENNQVVVENTTPEGFNRCCIKREFAMNNKFDENLNIGEDIDYMRRAQVMKIGNEEMYHHYRWGMETYHISGLGNFDFMDLNEQKKAWETIDRHFVNTVEEQEIILTPKVPNFLLNN